MHDYDYQLKILEILEAEIELQKKIHKIISASDLDESQLHQVLFRFRKKCENLITQR